MHTWLIPLARQSLLASRNVQDYFFSTYLYLGKHKCKKIHTVPYETTQYKKDK